MRTDLRIDGPSDQVLRASSGEIAFGNLVVTFPADDRLAIPEVGTTVQVGRHVDGENSLDADNQAEIDVSDSTGLLLSIQQINPDGGRNPPTPFWQLGSTTDGECVTGRSTPLREATMTPIFDVNAVLSQGASAVVADDAGVSFLAKSIWSFVVENDDETPWLYGFLFRVRPS